MNKPKLSKLMSRLLILAIIVYTILVIGYLNSEALTRVI